MLVFMFQFSVLRLSDSKTQNVLANLCRLVYNIYLSPDKGTVFLTAREPTELNKQSLNLRSCRIDKTTQEQMLVQST